MDKLGSMDALLGVRRAPVRWVCTGLMAAVAGVACGCSSGPENCEPSVGGALPDDGCGIFVSSSLGNDGNDGSRAKPVKTLDMATRLLEVKGGDVYACAETFHENAVSLFDNSLWGGFACADGWRYQGAGAKTELVVNGGNPAGIYVTSWDDASTIANVRVVMPLETSMEGISIAMYAGGRRPITITGSELIAADASGPSGTSVALKLDGTSSIEVIDSKLVAGNGADGAPGEAPTEPPRHGDGHIGVRGHDACDGSDYDVDPATTVCDDGTSVGGRGGLDASGGDGEDGQPLQVPNPLDGGLGGRGATAQATCTDGHPGLPGAVGLHGRGASAFPTIESNGLPYGSGESGGPGRLGMGGGGGGASRGGAAACPDGSTNGASGGWGGSGGCGGQGATGGSAGGLSVGIMVFFPSPPYLRVRGSSIQTGNGGRGGQGGIGQPGAAGGRGERGGDDLFGGLVGCNGADGGKGGDGGNGGGGRGGHSIGVLSVLYEGSGQPVDETQIEATFQLGTPSEGGPGGDPALDTGRGRAGEQLKFAVADYHEYGAP
jgi:hypothetical protein